MRNYDIPEKEILIDLYRNKKKTIKQISIILKMGYGKIHHWMQIYKIKSRSRSEVCGKYKMTKAIRKKISKANKGRFKLRDVTKKIIKNLYYKDNLTMLEIAKKYNVSDFTIRKFFRLNKIESKDNKSAQKHGELNWKFGTKGISLKGKDNPHFKGGKPKCIDCGKQLKDYNNKRCRKCYSNWKFGKNNPNWKNGISFLPYSIEFNNRLKLKIRTRDNFMCQCCGMTEEEHAKQYNENLHCHHIDYNKLDCKENNLITVCKFCNSQANSNRDYWYAFYTWIIENEIYKGVK